MDFLNLPHNVKIEIGKSLTQQDRLHLAYSCKLMFNTLIPPLYHTIVYTKIASDKIAKKKLEGIELPNADQTTLIHPSNVKLFFRTLREKSKLGVNYAEYVQILQLVECDNVDVFDLPTWREDQCPVFDNLKMFQFPSNLKIDPLTFEQAPNLCQIIVDENFCGMVEKQHGLINFIDVSKIGVLQFAGKLGRNEDMVIFKLLTTCPHLIRHLTQLHFNVDESKSYEMVYRRLVGFFAILRRMGLIMPNLKRLSIPLTNHSTAVILTLIGKHAYFENLSSLELFIEDDGKVLNLVTSMQQLSTMVKSKGFNINHLSLNYKLLKDNSEKNHLRAMMLMKFAESFKELTKFEMYLKIEGLNLSNLLMIIGTPLNNNHKSLRDVRLNIARPSENLIGNLLPSLPEIEHVFPKMKYLNECDCEVCTEILKEATSKKEKNKDGNNDVDIESIKVSTLMIMGHELDQLQTNTFNNRPFCSSMFLYRRFVKTGLSQNGYLFDHLLKDQMNECFSWMPSLKLFEICGLTYHIMSNGKFELLFDENFKGLDSELVKGIVEMGYLFNGNFTQFGTA
ncbi:unnamed protein product [Ambrosiozyma monospora]|uniref:Unnamed protein product n=1 Tax=Ambrosiozyma monospora TaxID=43982 RepID=A0A9W6YSI8_AMBMO|nr:unnamed protein product [Ambrosiozyma monospora]